MARRKKPVSAVRPRRARARVHTRAQAQTSRLEEPEAPTEGTDGAGGRAAPAMPQTHARSVGTAVLVAAHIASVEPGDGMCDEVLI